MRTLKTLIAAAVCGFILTVTPKANALLLAYGYRFMADAGQPTDLDGSLVILRPEFYGNGIYIEGYDLTDSAIPGFQDLTSANSTIVSESFSFDTNNYWTGSFTIEGDGYTFTGTDGPDGGSLNIGSDPNGTWSPLGSAAAPDTTKSFAMLAGVFALLGLFQRFAGRPLTGPVAAGNRPRRTQWGRTPRRSRRWW